MPQITGFLDLMDARSFGSVWYWFLLIAVWSWVGRGVLGVPMDVVNRARRAPEGEAGLFLLDWLSLALPRWRIGGRDGVVVLALAAFGLTSLAVLGFGYGLELAQALVLLLVPMALLFLMRLRLAQRLTPVMQQAHDGAVPPAEAATAALRIITLHRRLGFLLSVVAVALTAFWGAIWQLLHPNGL